MPNARKLLRKEAIKVIDHYIQHIESHTDAEVVVSVATESGRYDRAESIWGLVFGLGLLPFALNLEKLLNTLFWNEGTTRILATSLIFVLGFVFGSILASYLKRMRSLFVFQNEIDEEVISSALKIYGMHSMNHPDLKTIVLIYISLSERKVQILGDKFFLENIGQDEIVKIKNTLVAGLEKGIPQEGIIEVLKKLEKVLVEKCPRSIDEDRIDLTNIEFHHPRP